LCHLEDKDVIQFTVKWRKEEMYEAWKEQREGIKRV
jgi:hypothetical protein